MTRRASVSDLPRLEERRVSRSKETGPQEQASPNKSTDELPFVITASEVKVRKKQRRKKHNSKRT